MTLVKDTKISIWTFVVVLVVNTAAVFYWAGQVSSAVTTLKEYAMENRQQINKLREIHTKTE